MIAADLFECAGRSYRATVAVDNEDSAHRWGNVGLLVLSTPAMLGHVENVCVEWVSRCLAANAMTVGVSVSMEHLSPSPVPAEIDIQVELLGSDRALFDVGFSVWWQGQQIGRGRHRRAVVDRSNFASRIEAHCAVRQEQP